jgi:hypothetical protein
MSRPTFNLGAFLEKEKLKTDGSNFTTWFRTLRINLAPHKMGYVLEAAIGDAPREDASKEEKAVYQTKGWTILLLSKVACYLPWSLICKSALKR